MLHSLCDHPEHVERDLARRERERGHGEARQGAAAAGLVGVAHAHVVVGVLGGAAADVVRGRLGDGLETPPSKRKSVARIAASA